MDWKLPPDRHLTQSPQDDGFENWIEKVFKHTPSSVEKVMAKKEFTGSDTEAVWLEKLFGYMTTKQASLIIERAFKRYYK